MESRTFCSVNFADNTTGLISFKKMEQMNPEKTYMILIGKQNIQKEAEEIQIVTEYDQEEVMLKRQIKFLR